MTVEAQVLGASLRLSATELRADTAVLAKEYAGFPECLAEAQRLSPDSARARRAT